MTPPGFPRRHATIGCVRSEFCHIVIYEVTSVKVTRSLNGQIASINWFSLCEVTECVTRGRSAILFLVAAENKDIYSKQSSDIVQLFQAD